MLIYPPINPQLFLSDDEDYYFLRQKVLLYMFNI